MLKSSQKKESRPLLSELDPQVKALLEQFQANAAQHPAPTTSLSPEERVAASRQLVSTSAILGYQQSRFYDPKISTYQALLEKSLFACMFRARKNLFQLLPRPWFITMAGGFVAGDLESHDTLLRALANRAQCIVVSVAYRLAPENLYPAANDDAWTALRWVADHASEIGVDPQRLTVGGDSGGGLLAAWVAQKAAKDGPVLRLQVLLYPNLDATTSKP
jgi:acetyl esterase